MTSWKLCDARWQSIDAVTSPFHFVYLLANWIRIQGRFRLDFLPNELNDQTSIDHRANYSIRWKLFGNTRETGVFINIRVIFELSEIGERRITRICGFRRRNFRLLTLQPQRINDVCFASRDKLRLIPNTGPADNVLIIY